MKPILPAALSICLVWSLLLPLTAVARHSMPAVDVLRLLEEDEPLFLAAELEREGRSRGFAHVESGPLVRSSYHAHAHVP